LEVLLEDPISLGLLVTANMALAICHILLHILEQEGGIQLIVVRKVDKLESCLHHHIQYQDYSDETRKVRTHQIILTKITQTYLLLVRILLWLDNNLILSRNSYFYSKMTIEIWVLLRRGIRVLLLLF